MSLAQLRFTFDSIARTSRVRYNISLETLEESLDSFEKRGTLMRIYYGLMVVLLLLGLSFSSGASWLFDIETGLVACDYNDVAVPRDTGTRFSLSDELDFDYGSFIRFRAGYLIAGRHYLGALVAPLRLKASGTFDREVSFNGTEFPADTVVDAKYRFDSYRLTYRYKLVDKTKFELGVGGTFKIRDAEISLTSGTLSSSKKNTGPVPLVNFAFLWNATDKVSFMLSGDALAAPQGRAEDIFMGIKYGIAPNLSLRGGYRLLEGGADVEEVYNFTLIHYAAIAALINL